MPLVFALLGLAMIAAGGYAIAMGAPFVQLEQGWTMVVAGSVSASGGVLCLALSALLRETKRARLALERLFAEGQASARPYAATGPAAAEAAASAVHAGAWEGEAAPARRDDQPASQPAPDYDERKTAPNLAADMDAPADPNRPAEPAGEPRPSRSFTVGETTFAVFDDGSIEARMRGETRRFASMKEVRTYLETPRS